MTIEQGWMPVALSSAIEPGTSAGAMIDGAEIVVWRDNKGAAHVWEDRCPHRGMRMSFGFVRGDHIACLYHGWQYDTAGQCQYIPAHPDLDVPKTIKIATYAAEERNGIIWTCLSEGADSDALPDVAGTATPVRSLYVDCSMDDALAALADVVLPGSETAAQFDMIAHNAFLLSSGSTHLLIAGQSIAARRIALHMVLINAKSGLAPMIARWAEGLRLRLETQTAIAEVA